MEDNRTLFVGNLSDKVTEEILYELFLQVGPLDKIRRPKDNNTGNPKNFAFVIFKDACSVPYAMDVLKGTKLYSKELRLLFPRNSKQGQALNVTNDERRFPDPRRNRDIDNDRNYMSPRNNDRDFMSPRNNDRVFMSPRNNDRDYMSPRNYRHSGSVEEAEHRNFDRHRSRDNNNHRNNVSENIPFSPGSQNLAQDFLLHLGKQLLNQVSALPNTLGSPHYASQGGNFNYLGGTPATQRQGGKSHNQNHSTPNSYPYSSERRGSNYDRDRRRHDSRRR